MGEGREDTDAPLPRTVPDAVAFLLARMPPATREALLRFADEMDLRLEIARGVVPGMSVRAMLGLWGDNPELLAQVPPGHRYPDSASDYFLVECWRRLRAE